MIRTPDRAAAARTAKRRSFAFTITELIVVIAIIILIVAVAVPAFQSIIYSSEATVAQTRMSAGLKAARDYAMQAGPGEDTAAVFFYDFDPDPRRRTGGRLRIVPCIRVGELDDIPPPGGLGTGPGQTVRREVFVPIPGAEPVELPKGWMVRAFAPPGWVDSVWYEGTRYNSTDPAGHWVFPETGFYNRDEVLDFSNNQTARQSFMVRFQGGSGELSPTSTREVLVLAPRPSVLGRSTNPADVWKRADLASDLRRFARRILTSRDLMTGASPNEAQRLLGDRSADTVLVRPVWMLALYDERRLASAIGAEIDPVTGCIYKSGTNLPEFVNNIPGPANMVGRRIRQWIEGDTNFDDEVRKRAISSASGGGIRRGDAPEARLFTIDGFTGNLRLVEVEQ
jgi:hypothetical protein